MSEDILLAILGKQSGVSYVSLSEYGEIPEEAIRAVDEHNPDVVLFEFVERKLNNPPPSVSSELMDRMDRQRPE